MREPSLREQAQLQPLLSMRLRHSARYLCQARSREQLAWARQEAGRRGLPLLLLAGGSNLVPRDDFPGLCVLLRTAGWRLLDENADSAWVEVEAGEDLQGFLAACAQRGWHGLENLRSIPGSVGAGPVQNVGAYGQEFSDVVDSLLVWERAAGCERWLDASECWFGYRTSRFRGRDDTQILALRLRLRRKAEACLAHPALREAFGGARTPPAPEQVAAKVARMRACRLPDWRTQPNVGSFFVNPAVPADRAEELRAQLPGLPTRPAAQGRVQVAAARLIDHLGLRGLRRGPVEVSDRHALVLVNRGDAKGAQVMALADEVRGRVEEAWGIRLAVEPRLV